jgi:N-methylhydantoinase B
LIDEVKLREGSLLRPVFPAPLGMRGSTIMRQMVACMGLVARASEGQCNAAHSAYVIYHLRGRRDDGSLFLLSDGLGVGYGARPTADGNDAIYLVANENYPCEFVETSYPIRVVRYAIHPDTGGPGRYRGGCGVIREMEVLAPEAMLSVRIDSTNSPPWGVNGGKPARPGACVVNPGTDKERAIAPVSDGFIVRRGDIVRVMTGGGGGWGDPLERPTGRVLDDVLGGFVGGASAHRDYGVVLMPNGLSVDEKKTVELRASMRLMARGETPSGKSA